MPNDFIFYLYGFNKWRALRVAALKKELQIESGDLSADDLQRIEKLDKGLQQEIEQHEKDLKELYRLATGSQLKDDEITDSMLAKSYKDGLFDNAKGEKADELRSSLQFRADAISNAQTSLFYSLSDQYRKEADKLSKVDPASEEYRTYSKSTAYLCLLEQYNSLLYNFVRYAQISAKPEYAVTSSEKRELNDCKRRLTTGVGLRLTDMKSQLQSTVKKDADPKLNALTDALFEAADRKRVTELADDVINAEGIKPGYKAIAEEIKRIVSIGKGDEDYFNKYNDGVKALSAGLPEILIDEENPEKSHNILEIEDARLKNEPAAEEVAAPQPVPAPVQNNEQVPAQPAPAPAQPAPAPAQPAPAAPKPLPAQDGPMKIFGPRRRHMSETLEAKKLKMQASGDDMDKRDAFIRKLAAVNKMWGLGGVGGDMFGGPYEYIDNNIFDTNFELRSDYSVPTDDGILHLAHAATLAKGNILKMSMEDATLELMHAYYDAVRKYPIVNGAYGGDFFAEAMKRDRDPKALPAFSSYANGGGMRSGPAIFAAKSRLEAFLLGERNALPSHSAPRGVDGSMIISTVGFLAKNKVPKEEILAFCKKNFKEFNWNNTIKDYRKLHKAIGGGCPCKATETVQIAVMAFLEDKTNTYEGVVKLAISAGGDSDTIAAMAGDIAEAAYGIPEKIKYYIMDGLDKHQLTQALQFDAYAERIQYDLELDKKYQDKIICGQKPREIYEQALKEMFSGEELKKAFGDELPEELKALQSKVLGAINQPAEHSEDYANLSAMSAESAKALEELYQRMNADMIENFDADVVEKVHFLNRLTAVVNGLSIAPVAPKLQASEKNSIHDDTYKTLSERADEMAMSMLAKRMEARIPPEGADGRCYVVIEPKNREYELMKRAEAALRNIQQAVSKDFFTERSGNVLGNGTELAALFLHENYQRLKPVAGLDPDAPENAERKSEIIEAQNYLKILESEKLDDLLAAMNADANFSDFVKELNVSKLNEIVKQPGGTQTAYLAFAINRVNGIDANANEKLLNNAEQKNITVPRLKAITDYSRKMAKIRAAEQKAKQEENAANFETTIAAAAREWDKNQRALEQYTAFGERTKRYYNAALKSMAGGLDQIIKDSPEKNTIVLSEDAQLNTYDINALLKAVQDDLDKLLDVKNSDATRMMSSQSALENLETLSKCLQQRMMDSDDENTMRQASFINQLSSFIEEMKDAPADPYFDVQDTLYHDLGKRVDEISDMLDEHEADREKDPNAFELVQRAQQSLVKMQNTIADNYSSASDNGKTLEALKTGNDYAALILHETIQHCISITANKSGQAGNAQAATEDEIKKAKLILESFRGKNLESSIKTVSENASFKDYLNSFSLSKFDETLTSRQTMEEAVKLAFKSLGDAPEIVAAEKQAEEEQKKAAEEQAAREKKAAEEQAARQKKAAEKYVSELNAALDKELGILGTLNNLNRADKPSKLQTLGINSETFGKNLTDALTKLNKFADKYPEDEQLLANCMKAADKMSPIADNNEKFGKFLYEGEGGGMVKNITRKAKQIKQANQEKLASDRDKLKNIKGTFSRIADKEVSADQYKNCIKFINTALDKYHADPEMINACNDAAGALLNHVAQFQDKAFDAPDSKIAEVSVEIAEAARNIMKKATALEEKQDERFEQVKKASEEKLRKIEQSFKNNLDSIFGEKQPCGGIFNIEATIGYGQYQDDPRIKESINDAKALSEAICEKKKDSSKYPDYCVPKKAEGSETKISEFEKDKKALDDKLSAICRNCVANLRNHAKDSFDKVNLIYTRKNNDTFVKEYPFAAQVSLTYEKIFTKDVMEKILPKNDEFGKKAIMGLIDLNGKINRRLVQVKSPAKENSQKQPENNAGKKQGKKQHSLN